MSDTELALGAASIRHACKGEPDIIERLRKAMREAQTLWFTTNDDLRFRSAVAAAMMESTPEEQDRIKRSIHVLRSFNALVSGIPVDVEALAANVPDDTLPLMKLWHEAKAPDHA